jgi:hypothetical protein
VVLIFNEFQPIRAAQVQETLTVHVFPLNPGGIQVMPLRLVAVNPL